MKRDSQNVIMVAILLGVISVAAGSVLSFCYKLSQLNWYPRGSSVMPGIPAGSRSLPASLGSNAQSYNWNITIREVIYPIDPVVESGNTLTVEPGAQQTWVVVQMRVAYDGNVEAIPIDRQYFKLVGESGAVYPALANVGIENELSPKVRGFTPTLGNLAFIVDKNDPISFLFFQDTSGTRSRPLYFSLVEPTPIVITTTPIVR